MSRQREKKSKNGNEKCSDDDANEIFLYFNVHSENMRENIAIGTAATDEYDRMGAKSVSFMD